MHVRRETEDTFLVCLQPGEFVRQCLEQVCLDWGILGGSVSGIGGVRDVELGFWSSPDYLRKTLAGNWELLSLLGNISSYEGRPFAHLHVSLADENFNVVGGHFFEARVTATAEIFLYRTAAIVREWDAAVGAALWRPGTDL